MKANRERGFTLIELLVVIAILAVLAGLLLPALNTVSCRGDVADLKRAIDRCTAAATLGFSGSSPTDTGLSQCVAKAKSLITESVKKTWWSDNKGDILDKWNGFKKLYDDLRKEQPELPEIPEDPSQPEAPGGG